LLVTANVALSSLIISTLKLEAARSSEMLVLKRPIRCHIQVDGACFYQDLLLINYGHLFLYVKRAAAVQREHLVRDSMWYIIPTTTTPSPQASPISLSVGAVS
jgi:hypothetical protein